MRLASKTVTVTHVSPTGTDSTGRPISDTTVMTTTCAYKRRLASDTFNGGIVATDEIVFYFDPTVDVDLGDTVTIDGADYEVIVDPFIAWNHRTASPHHIEVRGRRTHR